MGRELVRFELEGGGQVLVETDEPGLGMQAVARDADGVVEAGERLREALETIRPTAEAVVATMRALSPQETTVKFGVKLSGEVGALVAKSSVEGNFEVTLKWTTSA